MIRVHFTGADFARTSVSPHPAPLVELKLSLMMLSRRDNDVFFGRWRRQLRASLPATTRPLWDLVSGYRGPAFIDPVSVTVAEGLDTVHATPPAAAALVAARPAPQRRQRLGHPSPGAGRRLSDHAGADLAGRA